MRVADIDILIIPGWGHPDPGHWLSRWQRGLKSARRVEQADWDKPLVDDWVERIVAAVGTGERPAVAVAYDCGVLAVAKAAPRLAQTRFAGAFLVVLPDLDPAMHDIWPARNGGFTPIPMPPLPFPAKLIGSSTDPYCSVERIQEIGRAWGADTSIIAGAGHLDVASGHGPWPEGALTFGGFLKSLG